MKITKLISLTALVVPFTLSGCSKSSSVDPGDATEAASNVSESVLSEAGQQATPTEGASGPGLLGNAITLAGNSPPNHPLATCSFFLGRSACTFDANLITWNGCVVAGSSAVLTGSWNESWTPGFCTNGTRPGSLTTANSVTRTTAGAGQVLTYPSGATLTTTTVSHTTYDGTVIPSTGITTTNASETRTIVIRGVRRVMRGANGAILFDHTITSSSGLVVTGKRANGDRLIVGSATLYHNLAQYKAAHTFNNVRWNTAGCCYPTSGSITSVMTGTRTGSISLAFTPDCGEANFTDTDGSTSTVTLTQCN